MQRRSWVLLGICALLGALLGFGYITSRTGNQSLTQAAAEQMIADMRDALHHKNVNGIMSYISPDPEVRLAGLRQERLRALLSSAFQNSGDLDAITNHITFINNGDEGRIEFDLVVRNKLAGGGGTGLDYNGHVTLHLRKVEVPHLLGLTHSAAWRIVNAEATGPDLTTFGDY